MFICGGFWEVYGGPNFSHELQQTVQEFNQHDVKVVFVGDNPEQAKDPQRHSRLASRWSWVSQPTSISMESHKEKNSMIYQAVQELPAAMEVTVIDLAPSVIDWDGFLTEEQQVLYYDTHHLSEAGALQLRPLFEPVFEELARKS